MDKEKKKARAIATEASSVMQAELRTYGLITYADFAKIEWQEWKKQNPEVISLHVT